VATPFFLRRSYSAYISVIISSTMVNFLDLAFTYLSINHDIRVLVSLDTYHPPSVT